jgi:NAD(P)-dependent dehydrogenase (short-subunit alcohol dehydrogenase family)
MTEDLIIEDPYIEHKRRRDHEWCDGACTNAGPHWYYGEEDKWMTHSAVVTGGSGRVGPIWKNELEQMGYWAFDFDLPTWDVTSLDDISMFKANILHNGFAPSVLVNNAAIDNPPGSDASFFGNLAEILDVNLTGATNMAKAFIPVMSKRKGGVIINVGSIMGNIGADWRNYPEGFEKPVAYNLSKAALIQLSRSITVQYGRDNVRSVTIAFGPLDTPDLPESFKSKFLPNVPLGRPISEQSWRAALRFAIEAPELAGQQILVDGGYTAW